jgi:hypothetical protein
VETDAEKNTIMDLMVSALVTGQSPLSPAFNRSETKVKLHTLPEIRKSLQDFTEVRLETLIGART